MIIVHYQTMKQKALAIVSECNNKIEGKFYSEKFVDESIEELRQISRELKLIRNTEEQKKLEQAIADGSRYNKEQKEV